jgi:adenylate kinase
MPSTNNQDPQFQDLEIKDAQVIFKTVWETLEVEIGHENLRFPKELILLGGAPGAGKGTHTHFINSARGLTCRPIVVSELLVTAEAQKIKNRGEMVGDGEVVEILFKRLLKEEFRDGAILDGFPRTRTQVECLKLLVDKIRLLHKEFQNTPLATSFRRPTIHAMVLFVSERTSIKRQLKRGKQIAKHNTEVLETGVGRTVDQRSTDLSETTARRRYRVFKEKTWDALNSLKEIYHYHYINAEGPKELVERNILHELKYQSSLELEVATFDRLRKLQLADEITRHARQELVKRLDSYELGHTELFGRVVDFIKSELMPTVQLHALTGRAIVKSEDPMFAEPLALSMLIDIFSERGYHAVVDKHTQEIPERVNLETGEIVRTLKATYRVQVYFKRSEIRRG